MIVSSANGEEIYPLSDNRSICVTQNGITLEIVIEDGAAYVLQADCPDLVCVNSQKIKKSGQTIVCAPAGVRLQVRGGDDGVDFVAG